jgi:hypothetical protein
VERGIGEAVLGYVKNMVMIIYMCSDPAVVEAKFTTDLKEILLCVQSLLKNASLFLILCQNKAFCLTTIVEEALARKSTT